MNIPKKIDPDHLKDTIVQVVFDPLLAPELLPGHLQASLAETFSYVPGATMKREIRVKAGEEFFLGPFEPGYFLDKSGKVKVTVKGSGLVFNMVDEYIGWNAYSSSIRAVLSTLFQANLFNKVSRVGIRYISQFPGLRLLDNLKMKLSVEIPNKNLESTQIRSEYKEGVFKIILTLINDVANAENSERQSIIDIDVIQVFDGLTESDAVMSAIDDGHAKQKTTFFGLLKDEFLETLNPTYV